MFYDTVANIWNYLLNSIRYAVYKRLPLMLWLPRAGKRTSRFLLPIYSRQPNAQTQKTVAYVCFVMKDTSILKELH